MRYLLAPFAILFYFIQGLRGWLYSKSILKIKKVPKPVISIGNITTGGTGKTPWVQKVSNILSSKNKKVCILSRGYSGDFDGVLAVTKTMDPRKCGDEPLWLVNNTEADVYVGRSRTQAAGKALSEVNPDIFLLDDGFQHRKIHRDLDIVLIDVSAPESHYSLLPMGRLREPFSSLKRASMVVLNKCNFVDAEIVASYVETIKRKAPQSNIFYADFSFSKWVPIIDELSQDFTNDKVSMTCGLGNPKSFVKTLNQLNIQPVKEFIFPDHYYWNPKDVEIMSYGMKRIGSKNLVMTEKDAVKLNRYKKHFFEMGIQLWVCKMQVQLRNRQEDFEKIILELGENKE